MLFSQRILQKVARAINLTRNMGVGYVLFRTRHELLVRSGAYKKRFPVKKDAPPIISVAEWRLLPGKFFFNGKASLRLEKRTSCSLENNYRDICNGVFTFFGQLKMNVGREYDWLTNPDNSFRYKNNLHWTEIADFSGDAGDIKFVWEKSRFTFLYDIIRYDYHFDKDCFEDVFREIDSWIDHNPPNTGPNYVSSQEIALRLLNWLFALNYYKDHISLTDKIFSKIITSLYWQVKHIYDNISFSRIAVRNNHAITETLGLFVCGVLLPFLPGAQQWRRKGRHWFEEEIAFQVYKDGTYLQFSMNYHRVVIQLMTWAIRISELNNIRLSPVVYERASCSLDFLFNCMNKDDGRLPNYGPNDGSLFFPLNNNDYTDFRPQLHALSVALRRENIHRNNEDQFWFGLNNQSPQIREQQNGTFSFPDGGYYLLREPESFTFIRCGRHKDRPTHADNLHVDIWHNGKNILRDSGSYRYNTNEDLKDYFMGTSSHNSVTVASRSQMLRGPRFIWYFWSQALRAGWTENDAEYRFDGAIKAFSYLDPAAVHKRTVIKKKNLDVWVVVDELTGLNRFRKKQSWHHDDHPLTIEAIADGVARESTSATSFNSLYYGMKTIGCASAFEFDSTIITTITIPQLQ